MPGNRMLSTTARRMAMSEDDKQKAERIKQIMAEESMDASSMSATAERMKSMSTGDMDMLLAELKNMGPAEKEQLKAMGMDPQMMEMSMKMMRDNPGVMKSAQKMMEKMSPEQMVAQSKQAQQMMGKMSPEQLEAAAKAMSAMPDSEVEKAVEDIAATIPSPSAGGASTGGLSAGGKGGASDPLVVDAMFRSAEYMSKPPSGGVTFRGFSTLAPIAALIGTKETDLTRSELAECWETGALGASRVDRAGFQRVWDEVQDLFEDDIMDEARDPNSSAARAAAAAEEEGGAAAMNVGENLSGDQMKMVNEQMKSMSDEDLQSMLMQMADMTPEQEARMRAMGVDPNIMKTSVKMMKDNPLMRKAAQAMISKMSPEQMMQASQQAQKQMAGMSKEDIEKAMKEMGK